MIYGMVEMFGNIVDTGSIYIICNTIFKRKSGTKNLHILIVIILQSMAMRLLNTIVGNSHWIVLFALLISTYFLCRIFFRVNGFKYAISVLLFFVLVAAVEIIVTLLIMRIFNIDNILLQQNEYRILGILSTKIVTLYILIYVSRIAGMNKFKIEKYSILTLVMMILSLTVFFMATGIYAESPQLGYHVIYVMVIAAIMAMISIIMLFVVRRIIEVTEERTRFATLENEYRNHIDYLKKLEELTDEIKTRRHDHKNHLIYISSLAESEGNPAVADYTKSLLRAESKIDNILVMKNKLMSALVNYNLGRMDDGRIKFDYNIDLQEAMHVSDVDMTIIIGNLLDNAMEACLNVIDKRRYINLNIGYGYGGIDIVMKNSFDGKVGITNNHVDTIKADKENHGYGLNNIKKTVEKYGGEFIISSKDNEFVAELLL